VAYALLRRTPVCHKGAVTSWVNIAVLPELTLTDGLQTVCWAPYSGKPRGLGYNYGGRKPCVLDLIGTVAAGIVAASRYHR